MADQPGGSTPATDRATSDSRDELRTISFRLREIQRLLATRVAQENRRLEAEGLDAVTADRFDGDPGSDD